MRDVWYKTRRVVAEASLRGVAASVELRECCALQDRQHGWIGISHTTSATGVRAACAGDSSIIQAVLSLSRMRCRGGRVAVRPVARALPRERRPNLTALQLSDGCRLVSIDIHTTPRYRYPVDVLYTSPPPTLPLILRLPVCTLATRPLCRRLDALTRKQTHVAVARRVKRGPYRILGHDCRGIVRDRR